MWFGVVSLFPEMFGIATQAGVLGRAVTQGVVELDVFNPREFVTDKHRRVDDRPYGGGPGMVMMVEPLSLALRAARKVAADRALDAAVVYLSPQGDRLDQRKVADLARRDGLILLAGRYEGVDERVIDAEVDEELSIGDYVLSGGELPAAVVIDAVARLVPGVVGDTRSVDEDSFVRGMLDHPHYTRPAEVDAHAVPDVLLSGHHAEIRRWRKREAVRRTLERRPDLLARAVLDDEERAILQELKDDGKY